MGGKSDLTPPTVVNTAEGPALVLAGKVVTKGGGFIQVRLKTEAGKFDASAYAGVEVVVSAPAGGNYFVFLRNQDTFFPWSYYGSSLNVSPEKRTVRIPWSAFGAQSVGRKQFRSDRLTSVALVAAFKDFDPYLKIYRVALYR